MEEWKPIEHFPGYIIDKHATVRSIDREVVDKNGHIRRVKGQEIKHKIRIIKTPGIGIGILVRCTVPLRRWGKNWDVDLYKILGRAFLPKPDDYEIHPYEVGITDEAKNHIIAPILQFLEFKRFYLKDREGNIVNPDWEYPEGRTKWMNDKLKKRWEEYFADRDDAYLYPVEDYYI